MTCTTTETNGQYPTKDPGSVLDYETDWTTWLRRPSEAIATSVWLLVVDPTDPTPLVVGSSSHDDTTATVWLSAGTLDTVYTLVNHITTNQGRTEDRSKYVTIQQH